MAPPDRMVHVSSGMAGAVLPVQLVATPPPPPLPPPPALPPPPVPPRSGASAPLFLVQPPPTAAASASARRRCMGSLRVHEALDVGVDERRQDLEQRAALAAGAEVQRRAQVRGHER